MNLTNVIPRGPSLFSNVETLLPSQETVASLQKIEKATYKNTTWIVNTHTHRYIFRDPLKRVGPQHFDKITEISYAAFLAGTTPELVRINKSSQQLLFKYIKPGSWPIYEDDSSPYLSMMKVLRRFHTSLKPLCPRFDEERISPFRFIFLAGDALVKESIVPSQFLQGLEKCRAIFSALQPILKEQLTICHGDFHMGNTILPKEDGKPLLIDFDYACAGDPLFDVAKFSVGQSPQARAELYRSYLGDRDPTAEEKAHFELIDLARLMVVAVNRFRLALDAKKQGLPLLSKEEMEEMCQSTTRLPTYLCMRNSDGTQNSLQKGAVFALHEFLRKTEEPEFSSELESVKTYPCSTQIQATAHKVEDKHSQFVPEGIVSAKFRHSTQHHRKFHITSIRIVNNRNGGMECEHLPFQTHDNGSGGQYGEPSNGHWHQ